MSQAVSTRAVSELLQWPAQGLTRVPLQVFAEPGLYAWEAYQCGNRFSTLR